MKTNRSKYHHQRLGIIYHRLINQINHIDKQISLNYSDPEYFKELKEDRFILQNKIDRVEKLVFNLWGL